MNNKDITVILLLFNTPENLINNLKVYRSFDIVILDQSNDYKFKSRVISTLKNIRYYKVTNTNNGFAKGINQLIKKVKTKYFLCTQPDVSISKNSIQELKRVYLKNKNCFLTVPNVKNNINKKLKNKKYFKGTKNFYGTIFFSSKKKFTDIGMFDENFFFYWEDIDLAKRIIMSGQKIIVSKKATAKHLGGKSSKAGIKNLFIRELNFKFGEYLFYYKNNKLSKFKIIRQLFNSIIYSIFYLLIFDKLNFLKNIFRIFGIVKFITFISIYVKKN